MRGLPEHVKTMDLAGRLTADRTLLEQRKEARRDYLRYAEQEADADREFRKTRATTFVKARSDGASVVQAELEAEAAAADHRHRRDIAHSLAKASLLRIDEAERGAVTVRDVHSSSERVDGLAA